YQVTVRGCPTAEALDHLRRGIDLKDGPTRPALVRILEERPGTAVLEMVLREGRNRQVRRMCAAAGHRVRRLVRVAVGSYRLDSLRPCTCRQLSEADVRRLVSQNGQGT